MSTVYTDEAVANSRIPKVEDFPDVIEAFREVFVELKSTSREVFVAATVFGGCANGNFNICSDIDIVALVDNTCATKENIFKLTSQSSLWVALQMAQHRFIQVSVYPVFLEELRTGESKNDRQFLRHVVLAAKSPGLLCGSYLNFEDFRLEAPDNTLVTTRNYIERKKGNLEKRLFSLNGISQEEVARMYLDTYQAPFHALRRVLDLQGKEYEDSKRGLVLALMEVAEDELCSALKDLHFRWKEYVSYIESAHFHKGMEKSPFSVDDVHKSIYVLERLHEFADSVAPTHKR